MPCVDIWDICSREPVAQMEKGRQRGWQRGEPCGVSTADSGFLPRGADAGYFVISSMTDLKSTCLFKTTMCGKQL